jgi:hypothetical protein
MKLKLLVAGVAMAVTAGMAAQAQAKTYVWNFADASYTASGTFQTNASNDVVSGGGVVNGPSANDTLTLFPNPTPGVKNTSPDGHWNYDDVVPVDFFGLLFTGVTNPFYNVFANGGGGSIGISFADGQTYNNNNAIIGQLSVTAVPEPATWAMTVLGVGMIGAGLRLSRRKSNMALTAVT